MKKLLLIIAFVFVAGAATSHAQVAWGVRLGLCYSTMNEEGLSISGKPSLDVGPVLYYSIKNNFYINSGLLFSIKNFGLSAEYESIKMNLYYLEVPAYFGYAFPLGKVSLYVQAGPYIGIKLYENYSYSGEYGDESGASDDYSTFNAGLGIMAGVNIKRFKIEIGYQQGLTNISSEPDWWTARIGSAFLGVSYVF